MGNYAVYHLEKGNTSSGGIGNHIDRKEGAEHTYRHADPNKKYLNQSFNLNSYCSMSLHKAIEERIKAGYNGKKTIRKDAVKYTTHILTGSHDKMKEIEKNPELLKNWVIENKKFLEEEFGKENIVRFVLHRDEKTPHLHAITVNLTNDGRLSAKEIIGNKKDMQNRQDKYAEFMQQFGLERGLKNTGIKHEDASEYYKRLNKSLEIEKTIDFNIDKTILGLKWATFGIDKDKTIENLKEAVKSQITTIKSKNFEIEKIKCEYQLINNEKNSSLYKISSLKNKVNHFNNAFENILVNDSMREEIIKNRLEIFINKSEIIINNSFDNEINKLFVINQVLKEVTLKIDTTNELKKLMDKYINPNKFDELFIKKINQKNTEIKEKAIEKEYKKVSYFVELLEDDFKQHEKENKLISLNKYNRLINEGLIKFNLEDYHQEITLELEKKLSSYINRFMGNNYFEKNIDQESREINKRIRKEIEKLEQIKEERKNNRSSRRSW